MKNEHALAKRNLELSFEFSRFVLTHPDLDKKLPEGAQVIFEVADDPELTRYNRTLGQRCKTAGQPVVVVKIKGFADTRLLDPRVSLAAP